MLIPRLNIRNSHLLTPEDFAQLRRNAKVLEQNERGIKLLQMQNGNILKVFHVRHTFTLTRVYSYARHFCRNADKLKRLGVPTVEIVQLFHFEESTDTAVLYRPLQGHTLRQLHISGLAEHGLMESFGRFVAQLHQHGVYFRSLHFGNVVRTPDGRLGLIDIADLKVYRHGLTNWHRARNFRHLQRYQADWESLPMAERKVFADSYFSTAQLPPKAASALRSSLKFLSGA
ncbi:toluene tolerance protein [Methylobacillus flagellatus]|uniref:toluene tolerance protein n=1 Tax=Methylobacillus flagellatus TaxID=405 RepID=UPI002853B521|nr:toluene tolerance protein [Methylobacillus flagellatus]MDR5170850.1 toluene tolerance protein [Methylobacillus flagellatus]